MCYQLVDGRGDTVRLSISKVASYEGVKVTSAIQTVTRKFVERDRVVFVTLSRTQPCVVGDANTVGTQFLATIVRVVKRRDRQATGEDSTVVESL